MHAKFVVYAIIENMEDLWAAKRGLIKKEVIRPIEVDDAELDTGATTLLMPKTLIQKLGLSLYKVRPARGLGGELTIGTYQTARLTIQDRDCSLDVGEIGDEFPVLSD